MQCRWVEIRKEGKIVLRCSGSRDRFQRRKKLGSDRKEKVSKRFLAISLDL